MDIINHLSQKDIYRTFQTIQKNILSPQYLMGFFFPKLTTFLDIKQFSKENWNNPCTLSDYHGLKLYIGNNKNNGYLANPCKIIYSALHKKWYKMKRKKVKLSRIQWNWTVIPKLVKTMKVVLKRKLILLCVYIRLKRRYLKLGI